MKIEKRVRQYLGETVAQHSATRLNLDHAHLQEPNCHTRTVASSAREYLTLYIIKTSVLFLAVDADPS